MGALDAVVVASGTEIQVNRKTVSLDSAYFRREFGAKNMRVSVPDAPADTLRCVLSVCQLAVGEPMPRRDSYGLTDALELAERLEFQTARKRFLRELIRRTPERDERALCEKIWRLKPNTPRLWDFLALNFNVFLMTALSDINLSKVLLSSELILGYRNVLRVILEWKKVHPEAGKPLVDTLLEHARFDCLSQEEIKVLINNECMPFGQWLLNRIEGNRNGLMFLRMDRPEDEKFETVARIKIPNYVASLELPNQYNGTGAARIEMPINERKVLGWGDPPRPSSRFFVTLGDFAVSVWFFNYDGWLCCSVVIDRRLKGNKKENLCEAVEGLLLQVYISTKTPEYQGNDFKVSTATPAQSVCRSNILKELTHEEWKGPAWRIMHQHEANNLLRVARNHRITTLQSFVDLRLLKEKNSNIST